MCVCVCVKDAILAMPQVPDLKALQLQIIRTQAPVVNSFAELQEVVRAREEIERTALQRKHLELYAASLDPTKDPVDMKGRVLSAYEVHTSSLSLPPLLLRLSLRCLVCLVFVCTQMLRYTEPTPIVNVKAPKKDSNGESKSVSSSKSDPSQATLQNEEALDLVRFIHMHF